jgi:tetratricopeptide (TPR) repeat protein
VAESPKEYRLVYLLGTAYEEAKEDRKALETLRTIPAQSDQFIAAQGRIAMILKRLQREDEAIESLLEAIRKKRDVPVFYTALASLYEDQKRFSQAEAILREGFKVLPDQIDLHYGLGILFDKTGRFEE